MAVNSKIAIRAGLVTIIALIAAGSGAMASERFIGAWNYTCDNEGACRAFAGIGTPEESIVAWTIHRSLTTGQINSIITVPLGVILKAGVRVYTADDRFFSLDYQICREDGCSATAVMDSAIREQLTATGSARVVFFAQTPGEEPKGASFELSVEGVSEVFKALDQGRN
jgi:invasion protein IalB